MTATMVCLCQTAKTGYNNAKTPTRFHIVKTSNCLELSMSAVYKKVTAPGFFIVDLSTQNKTENKLKKEKETIKLGIKITLLCL